MSTRLVATFVALLLLSACDGNGDASDPSGPSGLSGADRCANRDEAIARADVLGEPLAGDVTGDGRDDVATVVVDPDGPDGCRAFLWLEHAAEGDGDASEVLAIEQEGMEVGGVARLPRPVALLDLDDRRGAEIVLVLIAGASTEFAAVFSYGGGSLDRLAPEGGESVGGLFPHGGGAAQQHASDCTDEGEVVVSGAVIPSADTDRYLVTRTFFVREGDAFLADLARTEVHRDVAPRRVERFREFRGGIFGSCPPA